ncbi:MAG: hypothetical protein AB1938_13165 [Myxococcota bacterium]
MRVLWGCGLAVLLGAASCKREAPTPAAAPVPAAPKPADQRARFASFWAWAAEHLAELKKVETGREPVVESLGAELEKVDPGLTYELGLGKPVFELIISADGKKALFPLVKALVAAAPTLEGTTVIAFRPRKDADFRLKVGDVAVGGPDVSFVAQKDAERPGMIAVTAYVKGLTKENLEAVENGTFLLIEAVVGEYDLATKLGAIDVQPLPATPPEGAKPLAELPAVVDAWGR